MTRERSIAQNAALALTIAGGGAALWATCVERHWYALRTESLPVLPRGATPLRVLHISDLHLAPWQTHRLEWVRSLAAERPDLIVLTGDLMGHKHALSALKHTLEAFRGIPGVFVHGSNDYYAPIAKNPLRYLKEPSRLGTRERDIDNDALTAMLRDDLGWIDLNNSAADLPVGDTTLRFFGLGDPHISLDDAELMRQQLEALDGDGQREAKGEPFARIGVVHAPYTDALDTLLNAGSDMIFAGHTHGGQVRLPGVGALTSNCDLSPKQARGTSVWFSQERATFLHVSAGLGHSIYAPVRFACRPEATLITMTGR